MPGVELAGGILYLSFLIQSPVAAIWVTHDRDFGETPLLSSYQTRSSPGLHIPIRDHGSKRFHFQNLDENVVVFIGLRSNLLLAGIRFISQTYS